MTQKRALNGFRPFEFRSIPSATEGMRSRSNINSQYQTLVTSDDTMVWAETLDDGSRAVFKLYHHRGFISWSREKAFRFRVQREFETLGKLQQSGVPTTEPLYWSFGECSGLGRCELLVTKEIPDVVMLHDFLIPIAKGDWHKDFCNLYRLIRRMHQHGIYHGAMLPTNVLVSSREEAPLSFYIMDLPSAMVFPRDITGTRMSASDLLNVSMNLRNAFGAEYCEPYLREYGLEGRALKRLIHQLGCYAPSKHTRNGLRAEFGARELVANIGR